MTDARENARLAVEHDPHRTGGVVSADQHRAGLRLWKAICLAPSIEVCEALLRGERVPWSKLDPEFRERFGIRR